MNCQRDEYCRCDSCQKSMDDEAELMRWEFFRYSFVDEDGKRKDVRDVYPKKEGESAQI